MKKNKTLWDLVKSLKVARTGHILTKEETELNNFIAKHYI